ncbi:MAG TPA: ATP-dependent helicase HrpB [Candidatus Macondimonas sp.]|nr:ATP-dependent helicase HrpB [Candidatus Macondimonas sp.]
MTSPLPIVPLLPEIDRVLAMRGVLVLQAAPGAGKTTRVPPALLAAPWLAGRRILMIEPRRLAAVMAARRMAEERGESVGETVGYRVRLEQRIGPATRIEVVTDGIFTRLIQRDPALTDYGLVIFDECHERSLQTDLGLALALESRAALREDLRLLAMSATVDGAAYAGLLGDAPVLVCPGRSHPVSLHYWPDPARTAQNRGAVAHWQAAVRRALAETAGGILVFLPGVPEIRRLAGVLAEAGLDADVMLLPLYGDQSAAAQQAALAPAPPGRRKLVLATAVAETSLTLADITTVVDTGWARAARFDPARAMEHLVTVPVSRAAAEQRAGRAGRQGPGDCYRLYAERDFERAPAQDEPEIRQADLAGLALELAVWGVTDPTGLRWLDAPHPARFAQARALLQALDALDERGCITAHGKAMARLGVHPRLAHLLLRAREVGLGRLACRLAALIESRDPLRQGHDTVSADVHDRLACFEAGGRDGDTLKRLADQLARRLGLGHAGEAMPDADSVGRLLACAYPDRIAQRQGPGVYRLVSGRRARLDPADRLAGAPYLVVARLDAGETEARIHLAAPISLAALRELAGARIVDDTVVGFDAALGAMVTRRRQCLGSLVISESPLPRPDPAVLADGWTDFLSGPGWERLPWSGEAARLRARLAFMGRLEPAGDWPQVDDAALQENLAAWLGPFLVGVTHLAQIDEHVLHAALAAQVPATGLARLDRWLPTHIPTPAGNRARIDYTQDPPVLAVKLQELFGLGETPRLAQGRLALQVHLLSPAGRPLAITADLASFWKQAYPEVKKQMRGRYPRHPWPDDPLAATPTARAKPRARA